MNIPCLLGIVNLQKSWELFENTQDVFVITPRVSPNNTNDISHRGAHICDCNPVRVLAVTPPFPIHHGNGSAPLRMLSRLHGGLSSLSLPPNSEVK